MVNQHAWELGSSRSCIRELFAYGKERAAIVGAENVYDFSLGNPATPPPAAVQEALMAILDQEDPMAVHGYTAAEGAYATRLAIATSIGAKFDAGVTPAHLFMTAGAAPALTATFAALTLDKQTNFIAIAPYFPEYQVFSGVLGASLKVVSPAADFQIDVEQVASAIDQYTQGVIINSPNNPSGVIYTRETLTKLADLLVSKSKEYGHPIYIICDEPYRELAYDGKEVPYVPAIYDNTIVCYSYSKALSLPGDRIGYVLVSPTAEEGKDLMSAIAGASRSIGHVCAPATYQALIEKF